MARPAMGALRPKLLARLGGVRCPLLGKLTSAPDCLQLADSRLSPTAAIHPDGTVDLVQSGHSRWLCNDRFSTATF